MNGEILSIKTAKKLKEYEKEIERLNNIIKEVREYIEEHTTHYTSYLGKPKVVPKIELQREAYDKLLEILDKVSDK